MENSTDSKIAKYLKEIPIQRGLGSFEAGAVMTGEYLGVDSLSLRYGLVSEPGVIAEETDKLHTHDYDQLLMFIGGDPNDPLTLDAEVEVTMGDELIRQRFDIPTAVFIPKGMPHFSPVVTRLGSRLYFTAVHGAADLHADVTDETVTREDGQWGEFHNKYQGNLKALTFSRKGSFHYGSVLPDSADSIGTYVDGKPLNIPMNMSWNILYAPQHIGPFNAASGSYRAHMHPTNDELLVFFGLDPNDLADLHSDGDICLGPKAERERASFAKACVAVNPAGCFHLPLEFTRVDHPIVFSAISAGFIDDPELPPFVVDP